MESTDYFIMGTHAYFADSVWDFMVLRDRDPWELYYRESRFPGYYRIDNPPNTITINKIPGWLKVAIDGRKLKNYFERFARPETWKPVNKKFRETHQVGFICDGTSLSIEFTKSNGKIKEMHYFMDEFPEEWHPSYQKACRLLRYLGRHAGSARRYFAAYIYK